MTEPRLASSVQVSAFIRLAEIGGDFATVLRRGDPNSGAIMVIGMIRGKQPVVFERFPSLEHGSMWQQIMSVEIETETQITEFWQKRGSSDRDLWVIELDVVSTERLAEVLSSAD